jgi:hypothetical protein
MNKQKQDKDEHYLPTVDGEHAHNDRDDESEFIKRINLNERLAGEMREDGINCEAVEVSSLPIEKKSYYGYNFAMSSKLTTNRGCVRVKDKNIQFVQIIQRN